MIVSDQNLLRVAESTSVLRNEGETVAVSDHFSVDGTLIEVA